VEQERKEVENQGGNKQEISAENSSPQPQDLPLELTTQFDPSVNSAVFVVLSANTENKTVNLKIVWPETWEGREFASKISCDDISFHSKGEEKKVNNKEFFVELSELLSKRNSDSSVFFFGICNDSTCREIYKDCVLSVD